MNMKKGAIAFIFVLFLIIAGFLIHIYIQDAIKKGIRLKGCENSISLQNEAIKQQSLNRSILEKHKKDENIFLKSLESKYEPIFNREIEEKGIRDAFNIFFNSH